MADRDAASTAPVRLRTVHMYSSCLTVPSTSCEDLFNETEFPFLYSKPGAGEGKRSKGKRCGQLVVHRAPEAFIAKEIYDPKDTLGKRRQARILRSCSDTYATDIAYSINKKSRWSQVGAATLLNGMNDDKVDGQVVELRTICPVCRWSRSRVTALHEIGRDGEVTSKTAKGRGASFPSISTPPRGKQRGNRARRDITARHIDDDVQGNGWHVDEEPEKAKLRYILIHEKLRYYGRCTRFRFPKLRLDRVKHEDKSDMEQNELEQSTRLDESEHIPSRDVRFCLGDFMTDSTSNMASIGGHRVDSSRRALDIDNKDQLKMKLKPFKLVDITPVLRSPATFEFAEVFVDTRSDFNFLEQMKSLQDKYTVRWLDLNYQRVLIDATPALTLDKGYEGAPLGMLTIERCRNEKQHYLRVLLNSTIASPEGFDCNLYSKQLKNSGVCDVSSIVEATVRLLLRWRKSENQSVEALTRLSQRREHLHVFNVAAFSQPVRRITVERMAILLRAECEHLEADTFEKVEQDDFDGEVEEGSNSSQFGDMPSINAGVKCGTCAAFNSNDLYELDDCWMCRSCLRQMAINQIRLESLPICLPLVVPAGTTSYDVLPSILPLPLFNFYTKFAAVELIEQSMDDIIDLGECPGCKQMVDITRPSEYNSVQCGCGIVWCSECKKEPHWPMSCQMAAEWMRRWQQHGRDTHEHIQRLREITCCCLGPPILFGEAENFVECKNCNIGFNPQTMHITSKNGHPCRKVEKFCSLSDRILPSMPPLRKKIVEICRKARICRFDITKLNELGKASKKLKDSSGLGKLRNIRQTVLYIIEHGMAWYEEVIAIINYQRSNFIDSVDSLNSSVQRAIDMIKRHV
ncbi:hypothetical protein Aduo_016065 [Ancylostoma duodenale]